MVLQDYKIDGDYICISREELEKWRDHYYKLGLEGHRGPASFLSGYYNGKKDVFIDILRMFTPLEG